MADETEAPPAARHRALRNFGVLLSGEFLAQAVAFATALYLARRLGAHGFGVWVYASTVVTYLLLLVDGGTDVWGAREVSTRPGALRRSLGDILRVRLVLAGVAILLLAVAAAVSHRDQALALAFGVGSLVAYVLNVGWAHRGLESTAPALTTLVQRLLMAAAVFFLIQQGEAVQVTMWQGLTEIVAAVMLLALLRPSLPAREGPRGPSRARAVFAAAWPIGASRLVRGLPLAVATLVLGNSWPDAEVGQFGAATRVAILLLIVSSAFALATFPAISRACAEGGETEVRVVSAALRLAALVLAPVAAGGAVLAQPILALMFTKDLAAAAAPLQLMLAAFFLTGLTDNMRRVLYAGHRQALDLKLAIAASAISLVAAAVLVPRTGVVGATAALAAGEAALLGLVCWALRTSTPELPTARALLFPLLPAAGMALCVAAVAGHSLLISIPLGALVYLAMLWFMRAGILRDLRQLNLAALPGKS